MWLQSKHYIHFHNIPVGRGDASMPKLKKHILSFFKSINKDLFKQQVNSF